MPIIMFDQNDILVVFENTFVADQHESWFDPRIWERVKVDREFLAHRERDRRGDAYIAKFKDATIPSFVVTTM